MRYNVFLNYMGDWIVEDTVGDKLLINIPEFIGFKDESTAQYFADELNGLCAEIGGERDKLKSRNMDLEVEVDDLNQEVNFCHTVIDTLILNEGVDNVMELLNKCDKSVLEEMGWDYE